MNGKAYRRPSEGAGANSEAETIENQAPSDPATSADAESQVHLEIAALKTERDHFQDRFLRKAAEFDNYRKRTDREKIDAVQMAKSSVLTEVLPVVDACERALGSFSEAGDLNADLNYYREGVELLYKQLKDVLSRLGVSTISARGEKFDPHLHEALIRVETEDYEENVVIGELQRGYFFKDRLLRPAQVKVAIAPPKKTEEATQS